ncbi:MAG: hypothetical protein GY854_06015 [Deltaproteobacteria bacterium]|nr:hypothetical protein [Deltaproteobacteria bacterium]
MSRYPIARGNPGSYPDTDALMRTAEPERYLKNENWGDVKKNQYSFGTDSNVRIDSHCLRKGYMDSYRNRRNAEKKAAHFSRR